VDTYNPDVKAIEDAGRARRRATLENLSWSTVGRMRALIRSLSSAIDSAKLMQQAAKDRRL
jgi:hypothetical protein